MQALKILQIRDVKQPSRAHDTDSWIDFFVPNDLDTVQVTPSNQRSSKSVGNSGIVLEPGEGALIPTGIKMIIEPGYDLVFENKSGIATKFNLVIGAKVVDSSYRWEVHIHVINCSNIDQIITLGQKLAQGIIRKVELWEIETIDEGEFREFDNTERGEGGFGSTKGFTDMRTDNYEDDESEVAWA